MPQKYFFATLLGLQAGAIGPLADAQRTFALAQSSGFLKEGTTMAQVIPWTERLFGNTRLQAAIEKARRG